MSLRSAVILIAGKDGGGLTLPLPFVKPMMMFLALTICLTLDLKMVAMMVALMILMINQKDAFHTVSPQQPDTFELLLQCLGLLEGMVITLSLLVLSNVAFTPIHLFHLGMVRFSLVQFFEELWRTQNWTIALVHRLW
jgi:hypothetical protein